MFGAYRTPGLAPHRPVVGVLCCNETIDRPVQTVASRFIAPLSQIAGATVLLVPAMADACDARALSELLDGLLLTGSRSNVAARRYGVNDRPGETALDEERDEVALLLAARMIERGRPVFGICRGLQELNVLFGGTLIGMADEALHHHPDPVERFEKLFDHEHDVILANGGLLAAATRQLRIRVNSVHRQGVGRLGSGLQVEATCADDHLVEAFSAKPCGAPVLAVQWHPERPREGDVVGTVFFDLLRDALGVEAGKPDQAGHISRT